MNTGIVLTLRMGQIMMGLHASCEPFASKRLFHLQHPTRFISPFGSCRDAYLARAATASTTLRSASPKNTPDMMTLASTTILMCASSSAPPQWRHPPPMPQGRRLGPVQRLIEPDLKVLFAWHGYGFEHDDPSWRTQRVWIHSPSPLPYASTRGARPAPSRIP